jgi:hypothetical protein
MSFPNTLKWLFVGDNDELKRFNTREAKKARRSSFARHQEFSPELERLKYEVLRSSV